jgi:hypothetical protein
VTIDPGVTVTDPGADTLASGTVSITSGFEEGGDALSFAATGSTGNITASYSYPAGVLTLTSSGATATDAEWQSALRAVTYFSLDNTPPLTAKTVTFTVSDGANQSNNATKSIAMFRSSLGYGQNLTVGQSLVSGNGLYTAVMQTDGNLVVYGPSGAIWSTGTSGSGGSVLSLQDDHNLVVWGNATPLWSSGT